MGYEGFILPKDKKVESLSIVISKIPALEAQTFVYPAVAKAISTDGMLGLTTLPTPVVAAILKYVAVKQEDGEYLTLDTEERINKTFSQNFKLLPTIVVMMIKENFDFLTDGSLHEVLGIVEVEAESGL